MKQLLFFGLLLVFTGIGCKTELEPKLKRGTINTPVTRYVKGQGLTIEYQVNYGLDLVKNVYIRLEDTPPYNSIVAGGETTPTNGRGSFTIQNVTEERKYKYTVEVVQKDNRVARYVVSNFVTIPKS